MSTLDPKLEEIVSSLRELKKKKKIGFFDVNDIYYIGHGDFSVNMNSPHRPMSEIHMVNENVTRRSDYQHFTGYVGPAKSLFNIRKLFEFMNNVKKNIPKKLRPEIKNPSLYSED